MTWYKDGIRFQCQGSGQCCVSHGEFGFVYLDLADRQRMAKHLGLNTREFTKTYCDRVDGYFRLKEDPARPACMFLKNKRCGIYEARPTQCRTWPFWPEVMNAKVWAKEVAAFCPGVGKGPVRPLSEIQASLAQQRESERSMEKDAAL